LWSDNGGEYTSNEFRSYLKTEGVRHELTASNLLNRIVLRRRWVKAMLCDAKPPQQFALLTALYLRIQSPTKALPGLIPFVTRPAENWACGHKLYTHYNMS